MKIRLDEPGLEEIRLELDELSNSESM